MRTGIGIVLLATLGCTLDVFGAVVEPPALYPRDAAELGAPTRHDAAREGVPTRRFRDRGAGRLGSRSHNLLSGLSGREPPNF